MMLLSNHDMTPLLRLSQDPRRFAIPRHYLRPNMGKNRQINE